MQKNLKKNAMQFRYYEIPPDEQVLALLGEDWIRPYGDGINSLHFHNYMEIGMCHYGTGIMQIREKIHPFKAGSIAIIPPNIPHVTISESYSLASWEWMYFDIPSVLEEMSMVSPNEMDTKQMLNLLEGKPFFFQAEERPEIEMILRAIRDESEKKEYYYREKVRGLLQSFVAELLRMEGGPKQETIRKKPVSLTVAPAITYVQEHYAEEIKIKMLADVCSLSESHFRRIFFESMNMTPYEYVSLIRVKQACELLKKTSVSMEEIAYRVGFSNVSTLNRNFKRIMETTPYQWKKIQNKENHLMNANISALKGW